MIDNPYLTEQTMRQDISLEPGLEGILDFFEEFFKRIQDAFDNQSLSNAFSSLIEGTPPTIEDRALTKKMSSNDWDVISLIEIPHPSFIARDYAGYVKRIHKQIAELSDVSDRLVAPLANWFADVISEKISIERAPVVGEMKDIDDMIKETAKHFVRGKVQTRDNDTSPVGDLFARPSDFAEMGINLHTLQKFYTGFAYRKLSDEEERLLRNVKIFSETNSSSDVPSSVRKVIVEAMDAAASEIEYLGVLIYNGKVAAENYKLAQEVLEDKLS